MQQSDNNSGLTELITKLRGLAMQGPIRGLDRGDSSVGMTLLNELGIDYSSKEKPSFKGIVVSAARRKTRGKGNRVNLFAQVPDWTLSRCKSSREILENYGYLGDAGEPRLCCTVNSTRTNSQGLRLKLNNAKLRLEEIHLENGQETPVATWEITTLESRLMETHPESLWVQATVHEVSGREYFFYREAIYTGRPKVHHLRDLIDAGTLSVDHLISKKGRKFSEKGPLFKIDPENLGLLFPEPRVFGLL